MIKTPFNHCCGAHDSAGHCAFWCPFSLSGMPQVSAPSASAIEKRAELDDA
jgi:hypothetical protein